MTGTSYGGYSSWHGITHFPPEYLKAAAPICGMTDLVVDYETTRPDMRVYSEEMMGGSPSQVPELYKERSPINFISNIKGELLIIQGARDPNVTPENVNAVEKELKKNNIKYEKLVFENEGHGISKPENEKILYKKIADFFESAFGLDTA
jgi:dipeptidyl aminopeptidase/acylaminoacyl peptidase